MDDKKLYQLRKWVIASYSYINCFMDGFHDRDNAALIIKLAKIYDTLQLIQEIFDDDNI